MITDHERLSLSQLPLSPHFSYLEAIDSAEHPALVVNPPEITWIHLRKFANENLEEFRSVCCDNAPCHVNSFYRNYALNKAVGGVSKDGGKAHTSVHCVWDEDDKTLLGVAADLVPVKKNIYYAFRKTLDLNSGFKTFIIYPLKGFIHVDTQIMRPKTQWFVSITGKTYVELGKDQVKDIVKVLQTQFRLNIDDENPRAGE